MPLTLAAAPRHREVSGIRLGKVDQFGELTLGLGLKIAPDDDTLSDNEGTVFERRLTVIMKTVTPG